MSDCSDGRSSRAGADTKQKERNSVHGQTDHPDDQDRNRSDVAGVAQPADRLVRDVAGDREQQGCVDECGNDLEPVQTEGPLRVSTCRRRGVNRRRGHAQPQRIGGHVACIRQQCERTREHPDQHLHTKEGDDQDEGDQQRTQVAGTSANGRTTMIMALVAHVTSVNPVMVSTTELALPAGPRSAAAFPERRPTLWCTVTPGRRRVAMA